MSTYELKYVREKPIPSYKIKKVNELADLIEKYKYVLLVNITEVPAEVLHRTREMLRDKGSVLKVVKNNLFILALNKVKNKRPEVEGLKEWIKGQTAVIFTDKNPFSLKLFLDKNKIPREARAGDVLTKDIVIPAGNTNFPPGPILSLFNKLKIPTRIQEGSIWVTSDTVVAKTGDTVSQELAELLGKLGIRPIEVGLDVRAILLETKVISSKEVELDPEHYKKNIIEAHANAYNLAINVPIFVKETMNTIIIRAHQEALSLALNALMVTDETANIILAKAQVEANVLYNLIKAKRSEFS
ncbi:MAG: 50S ribosomal protein L10 [Thermoprotei archaeon]|nr:MAG: 50S ribosomal protein L10 [Thermoprotei archaeon]